MEKTYEEIEVGDIFKCEYGDFGNFVEVVFESNEIKDEYLKTIGHFKNGNRFEGYSINYNGKVNTYNVIGKE